MSKFNRCKSIRVAVLGRFQNRMPYTPGAPKRLQELIDGMHKRNWDVILIATNNSHFRRIFPPIISSLVELVASFLKLIRMHHSFHAIIFFSPLDGLIALAYKILINHHVKIIYCDRGDPIKSLLLKSNRKERGLISFLELMLTLHILKMTIIMSDKIIFNSRARLRETELLFKKKMTKCEVVPNNANPSWVRKWLWEINNNPNVIENIRSSWSGKKVIGFVGNLYILGNGLDVLLNAFKIVIEQFPEAVLILVGDGPDRDALKQLASEIGVGGKVYLMGGIKNPLIYVVNFDLFVHPARHHSSPNAILEALMCGVPVIGSRVGGIPEILEYDELLFSPNDINELANKIVRFYLDKSYREKVKRLVFEIRHKYMFDWQKAMCLSIYKTVFSTSIR